MNITSQILGQLLAEIDTAGSFATRFTDTTSDLHLEVKDVGPVRLPVTATTARKLCAVARPARHGYKDQTRLDTGVRDTWEIPKSRVSIDQRQWRKTLNPALERVRKDLGLPPQCGLKAELHNLLVYAPGQFFAAHQDSEKADNMVGSLVVGLPSRFSGGSIVIEHHGETLRARGSGQRLSFVAFYADCHHEVRPVTGGYRIVLTYNLIVQGNGAGANITGGRVDALAGAVRTFLDTPAPPRWSGDRHREPPDRLVYLLDHQYTRRALAWTLLKNADAARAAALREVARRLDCEIFLALADVHETWACEDEFHDHHRWGWDDDEEEPDDDFGEPVLTDLIDSAVELRDWIGPDGERPAVEVGRVVADELCYTRPSVDCEPFDSEHEGYMGNWGNTVDHWYHRAAVVLWPRKRTFVIRARMSPRWALDEIAGILAAGDTPHARAQAQCLLPLWPDAVASEGASGLLDKTLHLAAGLDDADTAAALLAPFSLHAMTPRAAARVPDLLDCYGLAWCRERLRQWTADDARYGTARASLEWLGSSLPPVCRAWCDGGTAHGQALASRLLEHRWAWLRRHIEQVSGYADAKARTTALSAVCAPVHGVIEACRIADRPDLHDEVLDRLTSSTGELPVQMSLDVLRAAQRGRRNAASSRPDLAPLHMHCAAVLTERLARPERAGDDWTIHTPLGCSCALCKTLDRFLRARGESRFEWPLAKAGRAHVHCVIDTADLPVRHTTRRSGRPFTLELEKTAALFERDAAERRLWAKELAWLEDTAGEFSPNKT